MVIYQYRIVDTIYPIRIARRAQRQASSGQGENVHNLRRAKNGNKGYTNPFLQGRRAQRLAARFRTQNEKTRVIKLVDEYGNNKFVRRHGKMNLTKHINVLSEMREVRTMV